MGNTSIVSAIACAAPVHPHTHGEHPRINPSTAALHGSSPHAWGTRCVYPHNLFCGRFIPTRMGNTTQVDNEALKTRVHPHTHGEHLIRTGTIFSNIGSSPHAWGTPYPRCQKHSMDRFIPTRMGNTSLEPTGSLVSAVHPHTHGEHLPRR